MPANTREFTDRKPRADARRNRERILKVAKQEFTRSGVNASLVVIVRQCCRNQAEVNLLIVVHATLVASGVSTFSLLNVLRKYVFIDIDETEGRCSPAR